MIHNKGQVKFTCPMCKKTFRGWSIFHAHLNIRHKIMPKFHKCACGAEFKSWRDFRKHILEIYEKGELMGHLVIFETEKVLGS